MMRTLIIDYRADVNASGYQNNTPLHEAALNNHHDAVEFLLQNGADAHKRNSFGVTPLELAKDELVLEMFKKHASTASTTNTGAAVASTSKQHCVDSNDDNEHLQRSQFDTTVTIKSEPIPSTSSIAATNGGRSRKQAPKKVLLFGTGMSAEQKALLNSLANQLKIKVAKEMSPNGENHKSKHLSLSLSRAFFVLIKDLIYVYGNANFHSHTCHLYDRKILHENT